MSLRYTGAWMQDGAFNPLTAPTPIYLYDLYAWGSGANGGLGLGNTTSYSSPKQVGSLSGWAKIALSSGGTSLAIKSDGTLWAWGLNDSGQLGLGNTTSYSSPKQVGNLNNWNFVSTFTNAGTFCLAVKTDGTLWSWGSNSYGELGLGNTTSYSSPKQVGALTNWKIARCGNNFVTAIKTDGTLWVWGAGSSVGNLGLNNASISYSSPKQVGSLTDWSIAFPSQGYVIATKTGGTLWSWGWNNDGNLGLGNTTNYSSPKQVGALTNWLIVSTNYKGCYAIKTDGTLWSWGWNGAGKLGLGNMTSYSSPKQVGALTNWAKLPIEQNGSSTAAIKTDGTLWTWGGGGTGVLGLGNTTSYSSPKQVGSLTTWSEVCTGQYALALKI